VGDFEVSLSGGMESPMKHHSFETLRLTLNSVGKTVGGGQFKWGACLLKGSGGVY